MAGLYFKSRSGHYKGTAYDFVYGPVANDNVYTTFTLYLAGVLTKEQTLESLKVKKLYDKDSPTTRLLSTNRKVHVMLEVRKIKREDGKLLLFSEAGIIRLWPQTERMIRVSYTEEKEFSPGQGRDLEELDRGRSETAYPQWDRAQRPTPEGMYREYVENAGNCMPIRQANAYGYYHAKGVYEGQRGSGSGKRVVNLIRSGYWGSQNTEPFFGRGTPPPVGRR